MNHPATGQLDAQLKQLNLQALLEDYQALAQVASQAGWPYQVYLAQLRQAAPWGRPDRRLRNRRQRRLSEAHFPLLKELADFDFAAIPQVNQQQIMALAQGHNLLQAQSVLFVGNPGLAKTHLRVPTGRGLGIPACRQDHRVRFYPVTHLVNELQEAQAHHQLPNYLEKALQHPLLILDEFGYVPFSPTGAQLLFQFCAALQERVALLVTTNLPFSAWRQVLGDERLASALLDRLTFRAHILELIGDSFRFRHGLQQHPIRSSPTDPLAQPETAP